MKKFIILSWVMTQLISLALETLTLEKERWITYEKNENDVDISSYYKYGSYGM